MFDFNEFISFVFHKTCKNIYFFEYIVIFSKIKYTFLIIFISIMPVNNQNTANGPN